ncbi:hypothetical protein M1116_03770 [Patescibacteria group bacterium]|nr:hypothetical protein [Patescibacteria group bacterium]
MAEYGKRPSWQWIVLYLIIGGVIYYGVYYFFLRKNNTYGGANTYGSATPMATTAPTNSSVVNVKNDPNKGSRLVSSTGMALYVFDNDKKDMSTCTGTCATTWPPYTVGTMTPGSLPTGVIVIKRSDGSQQYAYQNRPLYFYFKDKDSGDIYGDGIGGVWHLAKP